MNLFGFLSGISLYLTMGLVLIAALLTVTVRNLFHAAIFLTFTLLGVAIIYFFLHAEFLAGVQILVYVGAIMTLVIFAIMLTSKIGDPAVPQTNHQRWPVLAALLAFAFVLIPTIVKTHWKLSETGQMTDAVEIGKALMGKFVFPFELISVVLLVALIGAIATARSDQ